MRALSSWRCTVLMAVLLATASAAHAEIRLIGAASFAGNATDHSGLSEPLDGGIPHNRFGGFSGIEYTGEENRYVVLSDRGFGDGATRYRCRFHLVDIKIAPDAPEPVVATLKSSVFLNDEAGDYFTGSTAALDPTKSPYNPRLDPEGVRLDSQKRLLISDEYGPYLFAFSLGGTRVESLPLPQRYLIEKPSAVADEEDENNRSGRRANRGMEGLAVTPSGKIVGILQGPLLQDSRSDNGELKKGLNVRMLQMQANGAPEQEFLYPLEDNDNKLNEILALSETEFLVIERDGETGDEARFKKIMKISTQGATDISAIESLPLKKVPEGTQPVGKEVFIDLLDPAYGLVGATFPEKIEGLAFGPTLADGTRTLVVTSDDDFEEANSSWIYVFALDASERTAATP